jgi:hypothetical protein
MPGTNMVVVEHVLRAAQAVRRVRPTDSGRDRQKYDDPDDPTAAPRCTAWSLGSGPGARGPGAVAVVNC